MRYSRHGNGLYTGSLAYRCLQFCEKARFYVLLVSLGVVLGLSFALAGCASSKESGSPVAAQGSIAQSAVQDAEAIQAQQQQLVNVEVTVAAPVQKLLRDDTRGRPHQKFLILLSNGTTVLVAHNTGEAPRVPIAEGDIVRIHGEYIWNRKGGLIHWTHHSTTPRHEGGWIEFNGRRYE